MEIRVTSLTILLLASGAALPAMAQDTERARVFYGMDVDLANRYVWRGITRTNGWTLQPQVQGGVALAHGWLSGGVWATDELGNSSFDEASDFRPGVHGIGESNYWLQYSHSIMGIDGALGWMGYDFNGRIPGTSLPRKNTSELYTRLQLTRVRLAPTISLWQDIGPVKGAYLEGSITVPILANPLRTPFAALYLSLSGGASLGQARNPRDTTEAYNFLRNGFTSADLALGTRIVYSTPLGAFRARLEAHEQFSRDELARHVRRELGDRPHKGRFWVSMQLGWSLTSPTPDSR
jgi:hypothetical protein